jgi:hypothetical protein
MDANQILTITVFIVVMTIVGTIALAAVGYLAFRIRERRNPRRPGIDETMTRPYFFERVRIPGPPPEPEPVAVLAVESGTSRPALESGSRD